MKNMKVLVSVILLSIFTMLAICSQAQTKPVAKTPVSVKDTTIKGVKYQLYVGARGGRYILVTSKAGNQYKKYFSKK